MNDLVEALRRAGLIQAITLDVDDLGDVVGTPTGPLSIEGPSVIIDHRDQSADAIAAAVDRIRGWLAR